MQGKVLTPILKMLYGMSLFDVECGIPTERSMMGHGNREEEIINW